MKLKRLSRQDFLKLLAYGAGSLWLQGCGAFRQSPAPVAPQPAAPVRKPDVEPDYESDAAAGDEPALDVLVVGAGIAGLTAAYTLREQRIRVLEAADRPGGRTISGVRQGFHYAKGTEYLGEPTGVLKELIDALGLTPVEIPAPMDAHFHDGRFYYGESSLALLHIQESSREEYNRFVAQMQAAATDYEDVPDFDPDAELAELDEVTATEWFDTLEAPDIFYETYNVAARGLFGAALDEISALSAVPEIAFDFEGAESVEDIADLEEVDPSTEASAAYTFRTGITELTDALAAALGERLELQATVQAITATDAGYQVTYLTADGATQMLTAHQVILAVPAPVALAIAAAVLTPEQQELLRQIPFAQYITCALFSDAPIFDQAFDLAVPDDRFMTDVYDSTWVQRHYDPDLRDQPVYIAGVYIAPDSYEDTTLIDLDDDEILERIYTDLSDIFPDVQEKVTGYDIQRFRYAYPVMLPGAYERLMRLHELNADSDILLAGDYMIYPTFEAAAESGYLAAEMVLDQ